MRKLIRQQPNKKNCGVIAVAVVAEVPLSVSETAIGKKGCTRTKDLVKGLRSLGYDCPDRCIRCKNGVVPVPLAIAQLHDSRYPNTWHWIVIDGHKVWDGINGDPDGTAQWVSTAQITSYLPITKK